MAFQYGVTPTRAAADVVALDNVLAISRRRGGAMTVQRSVCWSVGHELGNMALYKAE